MPDVCDLYGRLVQTMLHMGYKMYVTDATCQENSGELYIWSI